MKTILASLAAASLFTLTACNSSALKEKEAALAASQHTIDSMNTALAKKQAIDSMSEVARIQYVIPQAVAPAPTAAPRSASVSHRVVRHYTAYSQPASVYTSTQQPVVYQQPSAPARKRGWSAKAKGAVIGAGTGAAAGAIINGRNRVAGAVIGGLLGAGAGTGLGAIIDHRNGR